MAKFKGVIHTDDEGVGKTQNSIQMKSFLKKRPNKQFKIEITEIAEKKSRPMMGYYRAGIVPQFMVALNALGNRFGEDETHQYIKQFSPVMEKKIVEIPGLEGLTKKYRSLGDEDFTDEDFIQYIEDLIIFAAEHLYLEIKDPIKV